MKRSNDDNTLATTFRHGDYCASRTLRVRYGFVCVSTRDKVGNASKKPEAGIGIGKTRIHKQHGFQAATAGSGVCRCHEVVSSLLYSVPGLAKFLEQTDPVCVRLGTTRPLTALKDRQQMAFAAVCCRTCGFAADLHSGFWMSNYMNGRNTTLLPVASWFQHGPNLLAPTRLERRKLEKTCISHGKVEKIK